jgi:hypothetical protein
VPERAQGVFFGLGEAFHSEFTNFS